MARCLSVIPRLPVLLGHQAQFDIPLQGLHVGVIDGVDLGAVGARQGRREQARHRHAGADRELPAWAVVLRVHGGGLRREWIAMPLQRAAAAATPSASRMLAP